MQSEIENLKKGVVVETADYKENKKIIGIVQSTVQSADGSVPPLSKQTAFKAPDEIVMKDIAEQPVIGDYSIPSLETPINNSPSVSQPLPDLPSQEPIPNMNGLNPVDTDTMIPATSTQLENPIQTSNPSVLESLVGDVSSISKEAVNSISNTLENVSGPIEKPNDFGEPVDLHKIDEPVVAAEPNELNDSLFVSPDLTQKQSDDNLNQELKPEASVPSSTNTVPQSDVSNINNSSDELLKIIEAKKGEISDKIAKYMIAASNMLVEEIIELIKLEMKNDKTENVQKTSNLTTTPTVSEQNELNPFSLSL